MDIIIVHHASSTCPQGNVYVIPYDEETFVFLNSFFFGKIGLYGITVTKSDCSDTRHAMCDMISKATKYNFTTTTTPTNLEFWKNNIVNYENGGRRGVLQLSSLPVDTDVKTILPPPLSPKTTTNE